MALWTHRHFTRSVGPLVDRELPLLIDGAVASHLDECDNCRWHAKFLIRLKEVLPRLALDGKINYMDEYHESYSIGVST